MKTKYCGGCEKDKPISEFNRRTLKSGRIIHQPRCRQCQRSTHTKYYANNRDRFTAYNKKRKSKLFRVLDEIKTKNGCKKCGENHPACLDFHHRSGSKKEEGLSVMVNNLRPLKIILKEIEKCDVLCANCHRKLHWKGR